MISLFPFWGKENWPSNKEVKYLLIISCIDQIYAGEKKKKQIISEVIFQENTLFDIRLELLKCNGNKMDEKINTCLFFVPALTQIIANRKAENLCQIKVSIKRNVC